MTPQRLSTFSKNANLALSAGAKAVPWLNGGGRCPTSAAHGWRGKRSALESEYVRVQVLTNSGALDRDKQLAVVEHFTDLVARAATKPELKQRTWVLLTEAPDGGWGLWGHAHTNAELVAAARAEAAKLSGGPGGPNAPVKRRL